MRIALVYDCFYPHTIGGVERLYRALAARLVLRGHQVTYLTRRQWAADETADAPPGVEVIAVSNDRALYTTSGRRRIGPPLRFGWGVFSHLLRHRRDYDVVQTCGFPYFSLLAARAACAFGGPPMVTDWVEVWNRAYWHRYLGPLGGRIGALVQGLCIRLTGAAFVLSELHARRLIAAGCRGEPTVVSGILEDQLANMNRDDTAREPLVVYAGRHIAEKNVGLIPAAIAAARAQIPNLRAAIFGDGPERPRVRREISRLGLDDVVTCPGFVPWPDVDAALRRSLCIVLPSCREGYGLLVVEAAARGTPSIVVRHPDNAATELIGEDENGLIVERAETAELAAAIVAIHARGPQFVERTRAWFERNAARLSIDTAITAYEAAYRQAHPSHRPDLEAQRQGTKT